MSITEYNKHYYHIPPKALDHKSISSEQLQSDVDEWLAKSSKNKIEPVPIGVSKFKSDIEKSKNRRKYRG